MSRTMTMSEAINEARRCLNCARPTCRTGCPIANNIPQFIRALSEAISVWPTKQLPNAATCPLSADVYARMNVNAKLTAF